MRPAGRRIPLVVSFGFVWLIRSGPGGRLRSYDEVGRAPAVVGFIMVRPCRRRVQWGLFASLVCVPGVTRFFRVRLASRRIHSGGTSGSSGSFGRAPVVDAFMRVRLVQWGARPGSWGSFWRALVVFRFIRARLVQSGVARVSSGSFAFVWFIRGRPAGGCVHSCSFTLFAFV